MRMVHCSTLPIAVNFHLSRKIRRVCYWFDLDVDFRAGRNLHASFIRYAKGA